MPSDQKNSSNAQIEALCNHCGQVFSTFLHQMEEQNAKVVCPVCGKDNDCPSPPETSQAQKR